MEYIVVSIAALVVAALTLYSGFGLGTLLMPVFALFFPVSVAVALTAALHLFNNVFKVGLLAKRADWRTVALFGIPAIITAFAGAWILVELADLPPVARYEALGGIREISPVKLVIAILIVVFVAMEIIPRFADMEFDRRWLPAGGALSGFFGGLSGHQGALRSAFLLRSGLSKEAFIATAAVVAVLVDLTRLAVYGTSFLGESFSRNAPLLVVAVLAAFAGTYAASRFMKKITMRTVHGIVSVMLLLIAVGLATGLI